MKLTSRLLALPAMIALLSGCGEEGNNLADPIVNEAETTTTCQNKNFCLTGQFIDEPVVGLNYKCNLVEGITDEEGAFSCPSNSVATFFLKSETGKRTIYLGKYRVRSLGSATGTPIQILLTVTPKDLVAKYPEKFPDADLNTEEGIQVTNILRLLQALDSDGQSVNKAVNRIVIDSKDKKAIDELAADVNLPDFAETSTFNSLLKPMFDKIEGKSLEAVTASQAIARFKQSLPVINAGVYEVVPTNANVLDSNGKVSYTGMLGKWTDSDLHSMVSMFFVVDRDGKSVGNAFEWQKTLTSAQLDNGLLIRDILLGVAPTHLDFSSVDMGFDSNGKVTPNFMLQAETGQIKITQGTLQKGNISGGERLYRNSYGLTETEEVDKTKLGIWQRISTNGVAQLTGTLNLQKNRTVNLFLEPSVWKTVDTVAVGERPIFPLHLKMTLRDNDKSAICGGTTGNGCLVGDMGFTILDNGNIITDRDNDCSVTDIATLQDQGDGVSNDVVQEHRLGTIATVLRDSTTKKIVPSIVPVMLVGNWARQLPNTDPWQKFYGFYMGMPSGLTGGSKVEIDISRVLDKIVSIQHQKDEQEKGLGVKPLWTNYANFMQFFSMSKADQEKNSTKLQGRVTSIQTQTCYNPQPKI